jgi:hypothetical protein
MNFICSLADSDFDNLNLIQPRLLAQYHCALFGVPAHNKDVGAGAPSFHLKRPFLYLLHVHFPFSLCPRKSVYISAIPK